MVTRRTAAEALGKIGDHRAVPALVRALDDSASAVREAAAYSLSQCGALDRATGERLAGLLLDPIPAVRIAAAQSLASLETLGVLWPVVAGYLDDDDPDIRRNVIRALQGGDAPELVRALAGHLQDRDAAVRRAAVVSLGESGVPVAGVFLHERLTRDSSPAVRAEAAYRLRFFDGREGLQDLKRTAEQDEHPQVRRWAEQTLRGLHDSD